MPSLLKPSWIATVPVPPDAASRRWSALAPLASAWSCDLSNDTLAWSRGVFELFGIAPGTKVDRRDVIGLYLDESRELMERLRREAIATCGSFTIEAQIRRIDGEPRWMRLTADVQCSGRGPVRLYGEKQDITAERIAFGAGGRA